MAGTTKHIEHNLGSVTDFTVDKILEYIHSNELKEGDSLPSAEFFCRELGVSRVIFREAISHLKGMRLIDSNRGKGFVISTANIFQLYDLILPIHLKDWNNVAALAQIRTIQEVGAFPLVVANIQQEGIKKLDVIIDSMFHLLEKNTFNSNEYIQLDAEFHFILCEAARNPLLEVVSRHYFRYWLEGLKSEQISAQPELDELYITTLSHQTILNSIKQQDVETGLLAIYKHYKKLLLK